jgi:S-formylglutathione hydrolase FrmB
MLHLAIPKPSKSKKNMVVAKSSVKEVDEMSVDELAQHRFFLASLTANKKQQQQQQKAVAKQSISISNECQTDQVYDHKFSSFKV